VRRVSDVLADEPFKLSQAEIEERVDQGLARLRENSGPLTHASADRRDPAEDEFRDDLARPLGGSVRGIALVGLVDALLIGVALVVIGVPLVVPLMVLTFLGAFLPLIGAFLAGLAAVLIALVSNGVVAALLVFGGIVAGIIGVFPRCPLRE
jgi:predicted PurR-regulated permease PerM